MKPIKINFTEEQVKEMTRLYVEEKMGTPSIAIAMNSSKGKVNRALKQAGIDMGTPGRRDLGGKTAAAKRYYSKNKTKLKKYHKEWTEDNREGLREYHAEWRDNNPEYRQSRIDYERNRRREDPKYRLAARTRTAVWTCLKEANVAKYRSTFEILGYTLEELMSHLESKFTEGMTWENYGEWHVDHIIPMSKFEFTTTDDHEFKLCWSLENLQPLWEFDNLSKGAR